MFRCFDAQLMVDSYAGRRLYRVRVVGERKGLFRFVAVDPVRLPGQRVVDAGAEGFAPQYAFRVFGQRDLFEES